jgi:hypothetical protein
MSNIINGLTRNDGVYTNVRPTIKTEITRDTVYRFSDKKHSSSTYTISPTGPKSKSSKDQKDSLNNIREEIKRQIDASKMRYRKLEDMSLHGLTP